MSEHTLTLKQYREQSIRDLMAECECSRSDAEYCRPIGQCFLDWRAALLQAALDGKVALRREVLDSFVRYAGERAFLDTFRCRTAQNHYMVPSVREKNRMAKVYMPIGR